MKAWDSNEANSCTSAGEGWAQFSGDVFTNKLEDSDQTFADIEDGFTSQLSEEVRDPNEVFARKANATDLFGKSEGASTTESGRRFDAFDAFWNYNSASSELNRGMFS